MKRFLWSSRAFLSISPERLALSPQCGFASSVLGNAISLEDQLARLRMIAETSPRVWA